MACRHVSWVAWVAVSALAVMFLSGAASSRADGFVWDLPVWMPPPPVPEDNPMSEAKVELGRRLFFDVKLSGPGYMSCASCHQPERGFTDGRPTAIGVTGQLHPRASMGLANIAYQTALTWADPGLRTLEEQALRPLFGEHPVEMAVAGYEETVLARLRSDPLYPRRFAAAFPETGGPIDFEAIAKAIAAFERTLLSFDAPYDRYLRGDREAITSAAMQGEALFFGRLGCGNCHGGPFLTDTIPEPRFHNTGLYNVDGRGALPAGNQGLIEHTGNAEDMGKFRTPSLRNVALTAPYVHDGSLPSLDAVIDHYAAGGNAARSTERSPLASDLVQGFNVTEGERRDLIAFLESLTDRAFVDSTSHRTPFR
jgi:cytochrome c peroxidase